MLNEFKEWAEAVLGSAYVYSMGMWTDRPGIAESKICAIQGNGGPGPDVDDRRARFRVILLGPANGRQHAAAIMADVQALALAALGDSVPCGAARVRAIGEPTGPGYTNETRAWFSLDFEVLF
ncbi:phage tail termination protein [Eoetvoesiella caeni]|uniref:DUF3168 domain-containing protein n=1 Tax=Eoetvoesiella caeni TaxID=645616 RepID=A0A366HAE6_9BURK|nr:hypothetical protein [Eoetvoesiella caeni]MCI2809390.1 hypothetical protein [Eoetvoesiella caeni]NYT54531.1 hypothetical protein [Eoetvoesiella caeni]RBP39279.1 hypothetical protein DFR37_10570 [Eoetvoesiella caeni]